MAGGYYLIPGYLIARLAIDASRRGQGYGEQLLLDALGKSHRRIRNRRRPDHRR
jgi:predicted GNAT family N-acyltransferase